MKSVISSFPKIVFHMVEDNLNPTKFLEVKFGFCASEKIDLTKTFIINDKYLTRILFTKNLIFAIIFPDLTSSKFTLSFIEIIIYRRRISISRIYNRISIKLRSS